MFRERLEIQSNWNYYLPQFLAGRHDFKVGFNNWIHTRGRHDGARGRCEPDVPKRRNERHQPAGAVQVTIFNSPFTVKRAVMNTAFYAQDSYSIGRLTAIAGIRWERVEGYIPVQTRPSSYYFPTGMIIGGLNVSLITGGTVTQYVVPDQFEEVRNAPLWKNWAPRVRCDLRPERQWQDGRSGRHGASTWTRSARAHRDPTRMVRYHSATPGTT